MNNGRRKGLFMAVGEGVTLRHYSCRFTDTFKQALSKGAEQSGYSRRQFNEWYSLCVIDFHSTWHKADLLDLRCELSCFDPPVANISPMKVNLNIEASLKLEEIMGRFTNRTAESFSDLKTRILFSAFATKLISLKIRYQD
jgi:hypothetical protein